jgi:hypothetical protein
MTHVTPNLVKFCIPYYNHMELADEIQDEAEGKDRRPVSRYYQRRAWASLRWPVDDGYEPWEGTDPKPIDDYLIWMTFLSGSLFSVMLYFDLPFVQPKVEARGYTSLAV